MSSIGAILQDVFARRVTRDPAYSLRRFARDLDISAGHLCDVMHGKRWFSPKSARRIGPLLDLSKGALATLYALADSHGAKSHVVRSKAIKAIDEETSRRAFVQLTVAQFARIFHWQHFAVFAALSSLSRTKTAVPVSTVAAMCGLREVDVIHSLSLLKATGVVQHHAASDPGGLWRSKVTNIESPSELPTSSIRSFHRSMLDSARASIDTQTTQQRLLNSLVLALDSTRLSEAQQRINDFCREFNRDFATTANADAVYGLALQLFQLKRPS